MSYPPQQEPHAYHQFPNPASASVVCPDPADGIAPFAGEAQANPVATSVQPYQVNHYNQDLRNHGSPLPRAPPPSYEYNVVEPELGLGGPSAFGEPESRRGGGGRGILELEQDGKFVEGGRCRDAWAAILFLCNLGAFIALAVIGIRRYSLGGGTWGGQPANGYLTLDLHTFSLFAWTVVVGFVISFGYLLLSQRFPGPLIRITFALSIIFYFGVAIFYFIVGYWSAAVIFFIFAVLYAMAWFWWKARIPFAAIMLETVTTITRAYPSTLLVALLALLLQTAYNFLFIFTFIGIYQAYYPPGAQLDIAVIFLIFSFYWTTQVIFYVVHTTIAGVFASYYFLGSGERNPTLKSLRRALTTSFGSVCFGALFISLLNLIRALVSDAQGNVNNPCGAFVLCVVQCLLGCIQALLEYFNYYAYTQVAIYGKDFCTAAKDTWTLIKDRGIEAIINDNLTGNVLTMGGILTGVLTALFGYLYLVITRPTYNAGGSMTAVLVLLCFLLGISMFGVIGTVIQSGVATTFVCLAEDPEALRRTKPVLFEKIRDTWPRIAQGV